MLRCMDIFLLCGFGKCFELDVTIEDCRFPSAWGTNKKEAEQKAAYNALVELGILEKTPFFPGPAGASQ